MQRQHDEQTRHSAAAVLREAPTVKDLPKFLLQEKLPLLITSSSTYRHRTNAGKLTREGYIGFTERRQLLYWPNREKGALEISTLFPEAFRDKYYFGWTGNHCYISFQEKRTRQLKLYAFSEETFELLEKVVNAQLKDWPEFTKADYFHQQEGKFLFSDSYQWITNRMSLDVNTGLLAAEEKDEMFKLLEEVRAENRRNADHYCSRHEILVAPLRIISTFRSIQINEKGNLVINGKHALIFAADHVEFVQQRETAETHDILSTAQKLKLENHVSPLVRYHRPDGSELWFDKARQMLYLRSSDRTIPEMAIPMVIKAHTACWASDGAICASDYFRPKNVDVIAVMDFHEKYFRPFINVIQQYATAAAT